MHLERGRTKYLFKFLADRFVGAPDSVGDSESIHAVWKRVEETRRGVKFKLMNALLKLRSYVREYSDLPAWVDIKAYVESIDAQMAALYNSMIADQGMRSRDTLYWERFNLRGTDLMLVRAAPDDINADHQANTANATADIAFGNYLRFLFKKHSIYRLARLGTASFFMLQKTSLSPIGMHHRRVRRLAAQFLWCGWKNWTTILPTMYHASWGRPSSCSSQCLAIWL
jgi:hypothetical protein